MSSKVPASSGTRKASKKIITTRPSSTRSQGISSGTLKRGPTNFHIRSSGGNIRVTGSEYLGAIQKATDEAPDYIYLSRPNVAGPMNTRLNQFASIYERWRPLKYRYRFTSSLPTSCSGTFCMASEPDPVIPYTQGEVGNVARLRALPGSKMFQAWESAYADIPSSRDYTSLWCEDPDAKVEGADRLDQAGTFYFCCAATTSVATGTTLGMLELEYEIEFFVPRLNSAAITRSAEFGFDAEAFAKLFENLDSVPILNTVLSFLKTYTGPIASTLASVLRLYESYGGSLGNGIISGGFPAGHHSLSIALCYVLPPDTAPYTTAIINTNAVYQSGYAALTRNTGPDSLDTIVNYLANNGTTFQRAYRINVDFGVAGAMRGFVDFMFDNGFNDDPDYVEFIYKSAGTEVSSDILSSDFIGMRRSKASKRAWAPSPWKKRSAKDKKGVRLTSESKEAMGDPPPVDRAVAAVAPPPPAASATPPPIGGAFALVRSPRSSVSYVSSSTPKVHTTK